MVSTERLLIEAIHNELDVMVSGATHLDSLW